MGISCPQNSGSYLFSYKSYNHIILFALVDAKYGFTCIAAGTNGQIGYAEVYIKSALGHCLIVIRTILKLSNNK